MSATVIRQGKVAMIRMASKSPLSLLLVITVEVNALRGCDGCYSPTMFPRLGISTMQTVFLDGKQMSARMILFSLSSLYGFQLQPFSGFPGDCHHLKSRWMPLRKISRYRCAE